MYVNKMLEVLINTDKSLSDYAFDFQDVHDADQDFYELNSDLPWIITWTYQWKISFTPVPSE